MEEVISKGIGDAMFYALAGMIVFGTFFVSREFASKKTKRAYGDLITYWGGILLWSAVVSGIYQSGKLGISTDNILHPLTSHFVTAFIILFVAAWHGASEGFKKRDEMLKGQKSSSTGERRDV